MTQFPVLKGKQIIKVLKKLVLFQSGWYRNPKNRGDTIK